VVETQSGTLRYQLCVPGCVEVPSLRGFHAERYLTVSVAPAEWLVRAGAYWHCSEAIPLVYVPALLA